MIISVYDMRRFDLGPERVHMTTSYKWRYRNIPSRMEHQRSSVFIIVCFVSYINKTGFWGNAIYVHLSISLCVRGERGERGERCYNPQNSEDSEKSDRV